MNQTLWLQIVYEIMRDLDKFKDASDAELGASLRHFLEVDSLDDVSPAEYDDTITLISERVKEREAYAAWGKNEAQAPDDTGAWYEEIHGTDAKHDDWRVSVTPCERGDWVTPLGVRFNITLHDGAYVGQAIGAVSVMERTMEKLASLGIKPAAQPKRQVNATPPVGNKRPADQPAQAVSGSQLVSSAGIALAVGEIGIVTAKAFKIVEKEATNDRGSYTYQRVTLSLDNDRYVSIMGKSNIRRFVKGAGIDEELFNFLDEWHELAPTIDIQIRLQEDKNTKQPKLNNEGEAWADFFNVAQSEDNPF